LVVHRFLHIIESRSRKSTFRSSLSGRQLLFILDDANYPERLPEILDLLSEHSVLITSRANLGGLDYPINLDFFNTDEAARLFIKNRERFNNDAEADTYLASLDKNQKQILQDCTQRLLGGLPLAITIAASLAARRSWSLTELNVRLDKQLFDTLNDPQQINKLHKKDGNVRLSFDLSYQLLPLENEGAERLIFDVTGVFSHDAPISTGALAKAAGFSISETEKALYILSDLSLLQLGESGVTLHPLARQYALEKLAERGDQAPWERMAKYYVEQVSKDSKILDYDWRNALQAVDWCFNNEVYKNGLNLMKKVDLFLFKSGYWTIREKVLTQSISVAEAAESIEMIWYFKDAQIDQLKRQDRTRGASSSIHLLSEWTKHFLEVKTAWADYSKSSSYKSFFQINKATSIDLVNLRECLKRRDWGTLGQITRSIGGTVKKHNPKIALEFPLAARSTTKNHPSNSKLDA